MPNLRPKSRNLNFEVFWNPGVFLTNFNCESIRTLQIYTDLQTQELLESTQYDTINKYITTTEIIKNFQNYTIYTNDVLITILSGYNRTTRPIAMNILLLGIAITIPFLKRVSSSNNLTCFEDICIPENYDKLIRPLLNTTNEILVDISKLKILKVDDFECTIKLSLW